MRRWLILISCGFASLPSIADVPDPGLMALASDQPALRAVDESIVQTPPVQIEVAPPKAAVIPASVTKPNESNKAPAAPAVPVSSVSSVTPAAAPATEAPEA